MTRSRSRIRARLRVSKPAGHTTASEATRSDSDRKPFKSLVLRPAKCATAMPSRSSSVTREASAAEFDCDTSSAAETELLSYINSTDAHLGPAGLERSVHQRLRAFAMDT
jgi:hypothetical protein